MCLLSIVFVTDVSLPLLCTFARMRKNLSLLPDQDPPKHIVAAVADLLRTSSKLLTVSEDGKRARV